MNRLDAVRSEPCLICGGANGQSDAHHLMIAGGRGTALKAEDDKAVPLCRLHHNELHRMGNEYLFWEKHMVDPFVFLARVAASNGERT